MDESHLETRFNNVAGAAAQSETINISDVIEVIETDPDFQESSPTSTMFNGGGEISQLPSTSIRQSSSSGARPGAFVRIIEQPASKALRFRYECEGRSAGSIPGASSTSENKTFPAIQVMGYQGRAVVVVSCVTKDEPYRAHPHNLVGREGCKRGVCTLEIPPDTMCMTFSNLGIQCVKKKDIDSALRTREEIKVDPFLQGFNHRNQTTSIDLNAVRLCFQVFIEGDRRGKFTHPLKPVVSEPIYDKKAMSDLLIVKLSHCVSYVDGGRNDIILLCEKVAKEDIQVRFFEEKDGRIVWEANGDFQPSQVHKQTAISFKAPKYRTLDITQPVKVFIQLRRPSDGATSEALPFEMLPLDSEPRKRKIQKLHDPNQLFSTFEGKNIAFDANIPIAIDSTVKMEPTDQNAYGQQQNYFPPLLPNYQLPSSSSSALFNIQETNWIPTNNANLEVVHSSLLNLDNQELQQINVNSGDLNTSAVIDTSTNLLSETFGQNLSLTDINDVVHNMNDNMTDSLSRLVNNTFMDHN